MKKQLSTSKRLPTQRLRLGLVRTGVKAGANGLPVARTKRVLKVDPIL